jgi:FlaA1/EpsC-like NDP-sugar epimerase
MDQIEKDLSEQTVEFESAARAIYSGRRILVTGAGGSIGSQLITKLVPFGPLRIVALDKDENAIYELQQDLLMRRVPIPVEPHVADIRDIWRLQSICRTFAPQVIFHAAAYKQVPLMELHPSEAVLGNVMGTKNLLDIVAGFGAERFVYVSTDEAGSPVTVMGATKRIGEMLVQSACKSGRLQAASVRFGNVLGSRGSVIPLFLSQIAEGGPLNITDPNVARSFITMEQAIQGILAAGCEAYRGEIFVADTDGPRTVEELAREMILLAGLNPGKDIEIRIVGVRPGESLAEELGCRSKKLKKTRFKGLSVVPSLNFDDAKLTQHISHLVQAARSVDPGAIHSVLKAMGIGYEQTTRSPSLNGCLPSPSTPAEQSEPSQSTPQSLPTVQAQHLAADQGIGPNANGLP